MNTLLLLLAASFALCLVFTPFLRQVALRCGLVDHPDGRRKIHSRPIPVVGGVAIFFATTVTLIAALAWSDTWTELTGDHGRVYFGLLLASAVIAAVGVVDDRRGLRGRHKLVGQFVAVAIVMAFGLQVRSIGLLGWQIDLGSLAPIFTAFWLLGAINSLNLIDGMDGLLGSVGVIVTLSMAVMAFLIGPAGWLAACIAAALAGALLGFLCFNFPPAAIFMGDCGSMLVGLVVGVLAIESSLKGPATVALAGPLALLVIPIFDTSAAIVRRKLTGRSIYTTDRGHLHHVLQRSGMSNRSVLLLVAGLCLLASGGALLTLARNNELYALLSGASVVGILVVRRLFGHAEFLLIKERLLAVAVAVRYGHQTGRVHQLEVRLQGSADWNELWRDLTACAEQLNLRTVCLDVNAPAIHEGYHARWDRLQGGDDPAAYWRAEIPLHAHGHVVGRLEVIAQRDHETVWRKVALVAKIVEDVELAVSNLTVPPRPGPRPAGSRPATPRGGEPAREAEGDAAVPTMQPV
jgi:UDP-GlcNAc:undecaprenyl-phosphate/decaprenyl-phosphate GlcNAc-1-phosphate transferase